MTRIHVLAYIRGFLLLVFYDAKGYQFRVANARGEVFGQREIFYLPEAAEREGRRWIQGRG